MIIEEKIDLWYILVGKWFLGKDCVKRIMGFGIIGFKFDGVEGTL